MENARAVYSKALAAFSVRRGGGGGSASGGGGGVAMHRGRGRRAPVRYYYHAACIGKGTEHNDRTSSAIHTQHLSCIRQQQVQVQQNRHAQPTTLFVDDHRRHRRTRMCSTTSSSSRSSSSSGFSDEMTKMYDYIADMHYHPKGPWAFMTRKIAAEIDRVQAATADGGDDQNNNNNNNNNNDTINTINTIHNPFRILDLASGRGEPASVYANELPNVHVTATDISDAMYERLKRIEQRYPNFQAQLADMQDLRCFADDTFDAVSCCYGYMFPPNKVQALQETFRVLKPGGMLICTTWNRIQHLRLLRRLLEYALQTNEIPPPPINPMALSKPGIWERMVRDAGFIEIEMEQSTYPFRFTSDPQFQFDCMTHVLRERLDAVGEGAWERAKSVFPELCRRYLRYEPGTGVLVAPENEFECLVARKPPLPSNSDITSKL